MPLALRLGPPQRVRSPQKKKKKQQQKQQQQQPKRRPAKPTQADWSFSVSDLDAYKLSPEEMVRCCCCCRSARRPLPHSLTLAATAAAGA